MIHGKPKHTGVGSGCEQVGRQLPAHAPILQSTSTPSAGLPKEAPRGIDVRLVSQVYLSANFQALLMQRRHTSAITNVDVSSTLNNFPFIPQRGDDVLFCVSAWPLGPDVALTWLEEAGHLPFVSVDRHRPIHSLDWV